MRRKKHIIISISCNIHNSLRDGIHRPRDMLLNDLQFKTTKYNRLMQITAIAAAAATTRRCEAAQRKEKCDEERNFYYSLAAVMLALFVVCMYKLIDLLKVAFNITIIALLFSATPRVIYIARQGNQPINC